MNANAQLSRRQFLSLARGLAAVCGLGLVGCGGSGTSAATTAAASTDATTDDSANITQLTVGFDQAYPPTASWATTASSLALTSTLPPRSAAATPGTSSSSPSTGTPRTRC
mgnify:CR=1 FL=1